jgi:aminodeoxyfutalosine synthase
MINHDQLRQYGLQDIGAKVAAGERLTCDEGELLLQCPNPVLVGSLAHFVRKKMYGLRTTYVLNQQLNYTNICVNGCLFCSYHRVKGQEGSFELTVPDIEEKITTHIQEPITEIHIVGGCHPELPLSYYVNMLQTIRKHRPKAVLKCFTAVEIAHIANIEGITSQEVLLRLKDAGLDMLPGGGAEIFAPPIRQQICPQKISGQKWLDISEQAHKMGIKTNCTMLFGHKESWRDRIEHLDALRQLQDRTYGFVCFIPLPFQTQHNQLTGIRPLTGIEELKTIAVSRLMLDNIPHIKSYWVMLGLKQAQTALFFGADDLDGTVVEEKVGHMAGADSPQILSRQELEDMIKGCGLDPVERDGLFHIP